MEMGCLSASFSSIEHEKLERVLLVGRSMGFFCGSGADRLLERMILLRNQMTEEEVVAADEQSLALAVIFR